MTHHAAPETIELIVMQHQVDRAFKEFYQRVSKGQDTLFAKKLCCPLHQALRDAQIPIVIIAGDNPKLKYEIVATTEYGNYRIDQAGHDILGEWDEVCADLSDCMDFQPTVVKFTGIEE